MLACIWGLDTPDTGQGVNRCVQAAARCSSAHSLYVLGRAWMASLPLSVGCILFSSKVISKTPLVELMKCLDFQGAEALLRTCIIHCLLSATIWARGLIANTWT